MGIQVEYNPDLALRAYDTQDREEECLPDLLKPKKIHRFLKKGQRNYWLQGEIPLIETNGEELSRSLASIKIIEATHTLINGEVWTKGLYEVLEVYTEEDNEIHFEGFQKVEKE
jgi:hypothetical protein